MSVYDLPTNEQREIAENALKRHSPIFDRFLGLGALKIRFVLLDKALIVQLAEKDDDLLGFSGLFEDWTAIQGRIVNKFIRRGVGVWVENEISFDVLKQSLTEFAESNACFSEKKPVPRIERAETGYNIFYNVGGVLVENNISSDVMRAIQSLTDVPIYKPQPKFKHKWEKIFPREVITDDLDFNDLWQNPESDSLVEMGINHTLRQVNQSNSQTNIELWEFTMEKI